MAFYTNNLGELNLSTLKLSGLILAVTFLVTTHSGVATSNTNQVTPSPLSSYISQPTITRIHKDNVGFLWIGTQQGLYRFDGNNVTKFDSTQDGINYLPNSDIRGISDNTAGDIFVATFGGGLFKFDNRTQSFQRLNTPSNETVFELTDLHRIGGDYHFAVSREKIVPIKHWQVERYNWLNSLLERLEISDVIDVIELSPYSALIAGKSILVKIDTKKNSYNSVDFAPGTGEIASISKISDAELVIGTSTGEILILDSSDYSTLRRVDLSDQSSTRITSILAHKNQIWIGTDNGIIVMDDNLVSENHLHQNNSGLSHDYITKLFMDSGILFVGTYQGLDQITLNSISNYNSRNSGVYNDVLAFTLDRLNRIWVGTYKGLFVYESSSGKHIQLDAFQNVTLPDNRVMALEAKNSDIWIGLQHHGLHRLELIDQKLTAISDPRNSDLAVTRILVSSNGQLWVTSYNKGIFRVEENRLVEVQAGAEESFTLLLETYDGQIFAGSERKLFKYQRETDNFQEVQLDFPSKSRRPMLLNLSNDSDGNIYIGTKDRGLYIWNYEDRMQSVSRVKRFGDEQQTGGLTIYGILFDDFGRIWCSTQSGIYILSQIGEAEFKLTKLDGLQANDFNFGAAFLHPNGDMYFGGVDGYNKLTPGAVNVSSHASPLIISAIEIIGKETLTHYDVSSLHSIQLPHDYSSLTINLSLLDFLNPRGHLYEHQLKSLDSGWIKDGSKNNVTYTNLEPGEYLFTAKARSTTGIYSKQAVSIGIEVLPPWWHTWWAYALYLIVGLAVLWGGMRIYRVNVLKEAALKLADEMQDTADRAQDDLQESQDIQDELVRAVYQHNLTTLELIGKCIVASGESDSANPKLMRHLKAMELLEQSYYFQGGQLMADLHSYVDRLCSHLLPQAKVDAATITTINLTTSEMLPAEIASPVAVILYELVTNAFEHAFSSDVAANYLEVKVELYNAHGDGSLLSLSVADDGIGLPERFTLGDSSSLSGLYVVKSLVESLSGAIHVSTTGDTRFEVSLPLPE